MAADDDVDAALAAAVVEWVRVCEGVGGWGVGVCVFVCALACSAGGAPWTNALGGLGTDGHVCEPDAARRDAGAAGRRRDPV
jgi:hypothetical protein